MGFLVTPTRMRHLWADVPEEAPDSYPTKRQGSETSEDGHAVTLQMLSPIALTAESWIAVVELHCRFEPDIPIIVWT